MTNATAGLQLKTRHRWLDDAVELLSSMRFAISLLVLIAIAAIIGTVLKQNEPMPNYVNQFGPFWFDVFDKFGLYAVYSTWWFLLIMGFLVVSTSLCIIRNAPKMLRDARSWRDTVREQSLRNFRHKSEWHAAQARDAAAAQLAQRVAAHGYQVKVVAKEQATLIAAKRGAANKWGYIFAHSAIVIICIGGLLDSNLPIRFQEWLLGKQPYSGNGIIAQIPQKYRLGVGNPTFRGNTLIPEGASSNTAIIPEQSGVLIQDLPFTITLKKFTIDYYSTGMPKLFASDVIVTDHQSGKQFPATIKVNEPLVYHGIAVYQSSFEDGGSRLKLAAYPMHGAAHATFALNGEVGGTTPLDKNYGDYTVEWSGFRAINVENMAQNGQDVRAVSSKQRFGGLGATLDRQLGSATKGLTAKNLKNVGPSVQYKLRDQNGQAREFNNYMLPVTMDGARVFLAGMRESPDSPFQYLRIPADDDDSVDDWMRLRAAIANPQLRELAAQRYAQHALSANHAIDPQLREQLEQSAARGLAVFAGNDKQAGYFAVAKFLEKLPSAEQEKAADVFMKILNGTLWELWQVAREQDKLPPVALNEHHAQFLQLASNALSDAFFYDAPVYLQLKQFDEVKASVLQVTRSPGKKVVYVGCLLLVLGIFSMLYIRERRLWIWLKPASDGGTDALMAMSTQRKTLDFDREFAQLSRQLPSADMPDNSKPV